MRTAAQRSEVIAENPTAANIETMPAGGSYTIPDANRAVMVYPLANEHAGDMVLIYVQGAGVVFVSDIYNPNPNASAGPGGQLVQDAIEAAGIEASLRIALSKSSARKLAEGELTFTKSIRQGEIRVSGSRREAKRLLNAFGMAR